MKKKPGRDYSISGITKSSDRPGDKGKIASQMPASVKESGKSRLIRNRVVPAVAKIIPHFKIIGF